VSPIPYRGWFLLNGQELANTSRLVAHMAPTVPVSDDQTASMMQCACQINIPYDDSWTGLREAIGDAPYVIENAPWYNPARPESAEFAGIWVLDAQGFDSVPWSREVNDSICGGGVPSRARPTARTLNFSALLVACTNAGARYGLDWLNCVLNQANALGGVDLQFYVAHPEDTAADPETLRRTFFGTVLTTSAATTENMGRDGGAPHRQASIYRVEWELVATNPYAYGSSSVLPVTWDTTAEESIEWAHAPDCSDTSSCGLPTIYNADCLPPDVPLTPAVIPTCGGCLPICSIEKRTWELPTQLGNCDDTVVTVRVTNNGADPLTVIMYWQPCGSTDPCERTGQLQVSGLPTDHTAVADSVTGRPYVAVDNVAHRQVGVVGTPNGAPWRPTTLDAMLCWELVAESAPGVDYTVTVELKDRDA
jgi:hypothetical protein